VTESTELTQATQREQHVSNRRQPASSLHGNGVVTKYYLFLVGGGFALLAAKGASWSSIIGLLASVAVLLATTWWCARQYYRTRDKGYRPVPAVTTTVCSSVIGALGAEFALDVLPTRPGLTRTSGQDRVRRRCRCGRAGLDS
jgi:hypothetical protein